MPNHKRVTIVLTVLLACLPSGRSGLAQEAEPSPEQVQFFESKIRPVLAENCYKCHGPEKQKSDLRLDSRASMLTGGLLGPAIEPGDPDKSLLVAAIRHDDELLKMPPSGKLDAEKVANLTRWVQMGAPWPGGDASAEAPPARRAEFAITDKDRSHWAFQPVERPDVPDVQNAGWVRNPIDAFILAKLEAEGLQPNPPAEKHELIRRAYYNLTGLPPTPDEVAAFLADDAPDAYERMIDRLLDSPRYGEAWGRHWLDLVRFAETNSYERDNPKPHAWRFRDYVIRSFNADKPYDRFVREQLAGDELPDADRESLIATGYYRLGIWDDEPTDREQARYDSLDDIVATTSQVFLGMTVDCARCHDHKIDPIPQKDYYRLVSFFQNINHYRNGGPTDEVPLFENAAEEEAYHQAVRELETRRDEVQGEIAAIEDGFRDAYEAEQAAQVRQADMDGLHYRFYRDTWDTLPDFDALKPEDTGAAPAATLRPEPSLARRRLRFCLRGDADRPRRRHVPLPSRLRRRFPADRRRAGRSSTYDGIHGVGEARTDTVELAKGPRADPAGILPALQRPGPERRAGPGPSFERRSLSASDRTERSEQPIDLARLIRREGAAAPGPGAVRTLRISAKHTPGADRARGARRKALCVTEAGSSAPETFVLMRGNAHAPGDPVEPGFLTVLDAPAGDSDPSARCEDDRPPARAGRLDRLAGEPADGPRHGQPALAVPLRPGDRPLAEQLRHAGRRADASRTARLAGRRAGRARLAAQAASPPDHDLQRLPDVVARQRRRPWTPTRQNDLFWRFDMRRLTAEEIRDSILAVSGQLEPGDVRPEHLSGDPRRGAGRSVGAREGLAHVAARRADPAERVHPRQAVAPGADPRELRLRRDRPLVARRGSARPSRPRRSGCSTASS